MSTLGVAVALAGRITGLSSIGRYLIALIPLVMGLSLIGWIHLPLDHIARVPIRAGGAFGTGLLLSLAIGPCGTPLLASVLSYAAFKGQVFYGAILLFMYGLGVGTPLLLVGTATGNLAHRLDEAGWKAWVDRGAGTMLLALSLYLFWTA
jgi:cytochrome c biogenesis protein CcdA